MENHEVVLKISASKESGYAKKVAGAMSWRLREQGFCKARAIKQDAINSTIKALAICNQRVKDANIVFCMELLFSKAANKPEASEEKSATAIEMIIQEVDSPRPATFIEYKVSGKQDPNANGPMKLAEALAAPIREEKGVTMKCIGPAAVYKSILASTIARGLIFPNGYDAVIVPSWDSLPQEDETLPPISFIKIDFWGKKLN